MNKQEVVHSKKLQVCIKSSTDDTVECLAVKSKQRMGDVLPKENAAFREMYKIQK